MPYIVKDKNRDNMFLKDNSRYGSKGESWTNDPNEARIFKSTSGVKNAVGRWVPNPKREEVKAKFKSNGKEPKYWDLPRPFSNMVLPDNLEIIEVSIGIQEV